MLIACEVFACFPVESVAVSVAVNEPVTRYAWLGFAVDPIEPSPKFQE